MSDLCACGHTREDHDPRDIYGKPMGMGCAAFIGDGGMSPPSCGCVEFVEASSTEEMRAAAKQGMTKELWE